MRSKGTTEEATEEVEGLEEEKAAKGIQETSSNEQEKRGAWHQESQGMRHLRGGGVTQPGEALCLRKHHRGWKVTLPTAPAFTVGSFSFFPFLKKILAEF